MRTSVGDLRGQDVIDSRDVIARIEELTEQQEGEELECTCKEHVENCDCEACFNGEESRKPDIATCGTCGFSWCMNCHPCPSARCHNEYNHLDEDEAIELADLKALAEEAEGSPDWTYGETLIRDSYFERYAMQLADDIGAINRESTWPNNCIDWERAARELQYDYFRVDFGGDEYWVRS